PATSSTLFPYTTLFRSWLNSPSGLSEVLLFSRAGIGEQLNAAVQSLAHMVAKAAAMPSPASPNLASSGLPTGVRAGDVTVGVQADRKSTRLNSSHEWIS